MILKQPACITIALLKLVYYWKMFSGERCGPLASFKAVVFSIKRVIY